MPVNPPEPGAVPNAVAAPVIATQLVPPVIGETDSPNTSRNEGDVITMPHVGAPRRPSVVGDDYTDRGDAAEFEILHARVGEFARGDRVTLADLGRHADVDRLVRLGAVNRLGPARTVPVVETVPTVPVVESVTSKPPRGK